MYDPAGYEKEQRLEAQNRTNRAYMAYGQKENKMKFNNNNSNGSSNGKAHGQKENNKMNNNNTSVDLKPIVAPVTNSFVVVTANGWKEVDSFDKAKKGLTNYLTFDLASTVAAVDAKNEQELRDFLAMHDITAKGNTLVALKNATYYVLKGTIAHIARAMSEVAFDGVVLSESIAAEPKVDAFGNVIDESKKAKTYRLLDKGVRCVEEGYYLNDSVRSEVSGDISKVPAAFLTAPGFVKTFVKYEGTGIGRREVSRTTKFSLELNKFVLHVFLAGKLLGMTGTNGIILAGFDFTNPDGTHQTTIEMLEAKKSRIYNKVESVTPVSAAVSVDAFGNPL